MGKTTKAVYFYIAEYFEEHGYAPSFREISEDCSISLSTVHHHVHALIEKGFLETEHPGSPRAIRLGGRQ